MPIRRAAVVIGVRTTGELTPLESPVAGAEAVAAWLTQEGFTVALLTDDKKPVTASAIKKAIKKIVGAGVFEQLVLYFSGHGYWKNNAEVWLLSGAPDDPDEAVSWVETIEYARDSGIPNVVMVSDACRSLPRTPKANRVRGSVVFPNKPTNTHVSAKIDRLQACLTGTSAYEVALTKNETTKTSVFTHCLRLAYTRPDSDMVLSIKDGRQTFEVVPNRRLEAFLKREVASVLSSVNVTLDQQPVIDVLSDEPAYIGRVRRPDASSLPPAPGPPPGPPGAAPVSVGDMARAVVEQNLGQPPGLALGGRRRVRVTKARFETVRATITPTSTVTRFESETGFTVSGADVKAVTAGAGVRVDWPVMERKGDKSSIRVWLPVRPNWCSVAITFGDGTGTVLPALSGYIGHVAVVEGGVANVSFVPADNSPRWRYYVGNKERIEELRSAVATAAQFGALRLGKQHARSFADQVRMAKQFDPSLGLYAAYAYTEAGLDQEVKSIRRYMYEDLRVSLFDVTMLQRSPAPDWISAAGIVPFCPLLSQGWHYLRPRRMKVPKALDGAQDELIPALWTTFNRKRMRLISAEMRNGRLK
jgi:hypothetical protein